MKAKFVWHHNHDRLFDIMFLSMEEQVSLIKRHEPAAKHETRLRLLKLVKGKLPNEVVTAANNLMWPNVTYRKARAEFNAAVAAHISEILALHDVECPNCPWDGRTIFPEEV